MNNEPTKSELPTFTPSDPSKIERTVFLKYDPFHDSVDDEKAEKCAEAFKPLAQFKKGK